MSNKKEVKQIANTTKNLGDVLTLKYHEKHKLDDAKEAIRAYNTSLKAHAILIRIG